MIWQGVAIEPIVTAELARAGYGPYLAPVVMERIVLHLVTMTDITEERVSMLVSELLPGIVDTLAEEAAEHWPSMTIH